MKTNKWIYAIMMIASLSWVACDDDDDDKPSLNDTDETFVEKAALANRTEVQFGELASTKATDPLVKDFAMKMVQEHNTAQNELKAISDDYDDVDWPEAMDQQHKDLFEDLNDRSGYSFDSLYMSSQVVDHQMTITNFETEINSGTVDRVKAYANKYLPHIREHHQQADSIKNVIIANQNTGDID
jgi:putative membrane protein